MARTRPGRTQIVSCCLLAVVLAGCARAERPGEQKPQAAAKSVRSVVRRGPVQLGVTVEPSPARLSDEPKLTVRLEYEPGVEVRKPRFGQSLGDFVIRDFREPLPRVDQGRQVIEQIYTLEPTRSGKLAVFPIAVTFVDKRPVGDGREHKLETEGLTVEIASVVATEAPSLAQLRPAAAPVELPAERLAAVWWAVAALAVVVVLIVAWRVVRRRRVAQERALSPRELAERELARLIEADWARRDVKQFYVELTGLVRRYIERTNGIRAPEQTTQEFLAEIARRHDFPGEEAQRLRDFLESADLVKFAAHEPRESDTEESLRRARRFVGVGAEEVRT
jgi:hypothetical protein